MNTLVNTKDIVWDNHGCMPLRADDSFLHELERYKSSGFDVVSLNVSFDVMPDDTGIKVISFFRRWIKQHSDKYRIAEQAADIQKNKQEGILSVVFDLEGLNAIGQQLDMLDLYYDLGVRWALMAYNKNNLVGGGCLDDDSGLTAFGQKVIARMNQLGMVVCCSHTGYRTVHDIFSIAQGPVIFSHSNPRTLWDHPRNITDELIRACADRDGVIGINGVGIFLGKNDTSTETLCKNIAYVAELVGSKHVGLSLDYAFDDDEMKGFLTNNRDMFPEEEFGDSLDIVEPERLSKIKEHLSGLGFHTQEIADILGNNWFRVAEQVWD